MQSPLANFIGVFSLVRDDRGFQVNPLCRHDITRSDRQIGNQGCTISEMRNTQTAELTAEKSHGNWVTVHSSFAGSLIRGLALGFVNCGHCGF